MNEPARLLAGEALARYYADHGLGIDGGTSAARWMPLRRLGLRLRNFDWRRRAIQRHDLHHLLTGYPCTAAGELQMAAWEFAAGRFPGIEATLFCLPLVGLGAVAAPRKSFLAYVRGRRSISLYRMADAVPLLEQPLAELRARVLPPVPPCAGPADFAGYIGLVLLSVAWMALPVLATIVLVKAA